MTEHKKVVLKDKPDVTFTIAPGETVWCAKEVSYTRTTTDIAMSFTASDTGMQVCLSCWEEVHGTLPDSCHMQMLEEMADQHIEHYRAKLAGWQGLKDEHFESATNVVQLKGMKPDA